MIAGIVAQVVTGWLRTQALQGKHNNFSTLHRVRHEHVVCCAGPDTYMMSSVPNVGSVVNRQS